MEREEIYSTGLDMIYLAASAIHGRLPDKNRVEKMNLPMVYKMAKRHSMQAIVYLSIAKCREKYGDEIIDPKLFDKMRGAYQKVLKRLVGFDLEREALCNFLAENGIWYVSLKGCVLQHYYPILGMRQMTDNDILIDQSAAKVVRDYFVNRGYSVYSYGKGNHDVYCKGNLTFEIHRDLCSDSGKLKTAYRYYRDVKKRLVEGNSPFELLFSPEDFYVYYIFHAYKHFSISGCGIRTLMDIFVYMQKECNKLDLKYISEQFCLLGTDNFERDSHRLAMKLFDLGSFDSDFSSELSAEEKTMLEYYIFSGTFGTVEQRIENGVTELSDSNVVSKKTKIKYIWKRIFPDVDYYKTQYPKISRIIITIPILWIVRIFRGIGKSKKLASEVDYLRKIK